MTTYWQEHQVGGPYANLEESEAALAERERLYPFLYGLMPVKQPGKVVLDYGCGPGHDTILFLRNGAKHVRYVDSSEMALTVTRHRLEMHGLTGRASGCGANHALWLAKQTSSVRLRVDHLHCAGVLHHTEHPDRILRRLRESLIEGGEARFMVYDGELSTHSQSDVPITHWWTPDEFLDMCCEAGFDGTHVGSYPCSAPWRPNCYAACFRLT